MSRTAIIGCRSQSMFGNQLSSTRMKSRPPYSSSHFDIALAMTVSGVFTVVDWVAAAKINGTALTSSLLSGKPNLVERISDPKTGLRIKQAIEEKVA